MARPTPIGRNLDARKIDNPARLRENFAATELQLTAAELTQIASLDQGVRLHRRRLRAIPGSPWTLENLWDEPQKT